jgi:HK97 family phage major capsid protein
VNSGGTEKNGTTLGLFPLPCAAEKSAPPFFLWRPQRSSHVSRKAIELREKRARIHAEAMALLGPEGTKLSTENKRKFDLLLMECDALKVEIDREEEAEARNLGIGGGDDRERLDRLGRELRSSRRPPEAQIGEDGFSEAINSASERRFHKAWLNAIRHGVLPSEKGGRGVSEEDRAILLSRRESRDLGVGSGSAGGDIVPTGFMYELEKAMKWYGSMLQSSDVFDTSTGQPLPWPNVNDTTNSGELIAENSIVSTQDVTFGSITFGAFKFSTKLIKVSIELLQDSAFDVESMLRDLFAIRLGRILNTKFTVGVGTTEPNGIITAATSGVAAAAGSAANTGGTETGATTIGSNDLVELEHSVDPAYRRGASWMMHDSTLKSLKEILDKYGRPLWQPGIAAGAPDLLMGYPYFINNDMATVAASAKTVLFGDMKKYKVRRVKEFRLLRLVERFAEYGQVGFLGFARYDGNLLDAGTHPVKYLVQHS